MEVALPCRIYGFNEDPARKGFWLSLDFILPEDPQDSSRSGERLWVSDQNAQSLRQFYGDVVELVLSDEVDKHDVATPGVFSAKIWETRSRIQDTEGGDVSLLVSDGKRWTKDNKLSFEVPSLYVLFFFSKRLSRRIVLFFRHPEPEDPWAHKRRR